MLKLRTTVLWVLAVAGVCLLILAQGVRHGFDAVSNASTLGTVVLFLPVSVAMTFLAGVVNVIAWQAPPRWTARLFALLFGAGIAAVVPFIVYNIMVSFLVAILSLFFWHGYGRERGTGIQLTGLLTTVLILPVFMSVASIWVQMFH